jgi:hypothetical protein
MSVFNHVVIPWYHYRIHSFHLHYAHFHRHSTEIRIRRQFSKSLWILINEFVIIIKALPRPRFVCPIKGYMSCWSQILSEYQPVD